MVLGLLVSFLVVFLFADAFTLHEGAQTSANQIIDFLVDGPGTNQTYNKLSTFVDTIGNRVSGSINLRNAVNYMLKALEDDGLENVHGEAVTIPHWERGNEHCELVSPRPYKMAMLGLGTSIGTPPEGITAEAIVVSSFDDLSAKAAMNLTQGKIIVFNEYCDWTDNPVGCYGIAVAYRSGGAVAAAQAGGVASLIKTVASFSIDSPHTGVQSYSDSVKKIPTACLTIEDVEMLARMQARGDHITIHLYMEAQNLPNVTSYNVVAEWTGYMYPDEVVLVSGHLDSWDVGQGAMDDGGGAVASWQVLSTLRQLNIRAKRTIRLVMWSCEEFGGVGSLQYYQAHQANQSLFSLMMESDMGTFVPYGIQFTGSNASQLIMQQVVDLLAPINASSLLPNGGETDTGWWQQDGVPLASLASENDRYFYFHHSHGDMMTIYDPPELDLASAALAVTAFTVADLDEMLPR